MTLIRTQDLTKTFYHPLTRKPVDAVHQLSMEVGAGEIFGFLGPNGAGKTTTIKILAGLIRATSGNAEILGKPVGDPSTHGRLGYLPEGPYFYDYLTGAELLDFMANLCGMARAARQKRTTELLELVGMTHAGDLALRKYSKGMLQRIGIAQALVHDPQLIILDEPMSGLDPVGRRELRDLILRLRDEKKTVFFSTHILADVEIICDRVAILKKGELKQLAPLDALMKQSHAYTEVAVVGLDEAARSQLLGHAADGSVEVGGRLVLRANDDADAAALVDMARELGGRVTRMVPVQRSLEDIFIDQVGG